MYTCNKILSHHICLLSVEASVTAEANSESEFRRSLNLSEVLSAFEMLRHSDNVMLYKNQETILLQFFLQYQIITDA